MGTKKDKKGSLDFSGIDELEKKGDVVLVLYSHRSIVTKRS